MTSSDTPLERALSAARRWKTYPDSPPRAIYQSWVAVMAEEVERLRTALRWYGDENNYHSNGAPMTPYTNGAPDPTQPRLDRGLIARRALAGAPMTETEVHHTLQEVRAFLGQIVAWLQQARGGDPTALAYCDTQVKAAIGQLDERFPQLKKTVSESR